MQVPQVPEVQFVGSRTPQASACSTMVSPGLTAHWPKRCGPRKKRITGEGGEVTFGVSCAVRLAGLADMSGTSSSFFSGPAARLLVEEQASLLHPLVELGRSCTGS